MKRLYLIFLFCEVFMFPGFVFSQVSLTGGSYQQDFDVLANTGTLSTVPPGWLFLEAGTNANNLYTAGTGSGNAGDTYSYGLAGNTDRAFGGLLSGSLTPTIGAFFVNNTGSILTSITISYTGEQWRLGTADRAPDTLNFQISTDAASLATGTWVDFDALDFTSPSVTAPVGLRNGNETANRKMISFTIASLAIQNGGVFYLRWTDANVSGADDGLGIDDFSITTGGADLTPPSVKALSPVNNAAAVTPSTLPAIEFSEGIIANAGNITIHNATNGTAQVISVLSPQAQITATTLTLNITLQPLTSYYIEIDPGAVKDASGNSFAGLVGSNSWAFTTGEQQLAFDFNDCSGTRLSGGFTQYSVTGPIVWACTTFGQTGNAVQINGFSGTAQENEDWLISPAFNLTGFDFPLLSFASRTRFVGPALKLMVSVNYDGIGNPKNYTWTELQGRFPDQDSDVWTTSSDINLSTFKNPQVYIAFVYNSSASIGAARWTIDDIVIKNSATTPKPGLLFKPLELDFDYIASGGKTPAQPVTITAFNLKGNLTVKAPPGFSISTDSLTYVGQVVIAMNEAESVNRKLYARFQPSIQNKDYSGQIQISSTELDTATTLLLGSSLRALKVVNWNIEWFGSTEFGPTNEMLQQENVKVIVQKINADVFALEEVVDTLKLKQLVDQLPGYAYTISDFSSYADDLNDPDYPGAQKLAFVYKTSVVRNLKTYGVLRYGGGPEAYNAWSSGRFPYFIQAEVTLGGVTDTVNFVVIHAKANTGSVAERVESWQRRKQGIDELKDTLDKYHPYSNIILLGDFNDDLDSTIAPNIPGNVSSYINLINDSVDYKLLTLPLSRSGARSTVSFDNVIDHQVASNEMGVAYIPGSARILTNVTNFVSAYATTTTDHYPVQARYDLKFFKNPIDVGYFLAIPWMNKVEFIWYTNHEINSNYFVVERSRNGNKFEPVDSLDGKGDSREWSLYNLDLDNPWPGKTSYRLRTVSLDGTVTYSNIITINHKLFNLFFSAYSYEPTMTRVVYVVPKTEQGTLQMMDISGRIYYERKLTFIKGKNIQQIPTSAMPAGTYVVRVIHKNRIESSKVVIKK